MQFRTPVELPRERVALDHTHRVLLLGSCFAEHVGRRMADACFRADVNPFGVLYNPESVALALTALLDGLPPDSYFCDAGGVWHSWLHSGAFSAPTQEECRARVEARLLPARCQLAAMDRLVVTLGTSRVYRLRADRRVVANCHKVPAACFAEEALGVADVVSRWSALLDRLFALRPGLDVVFTVSPYRYAKYGLHGSQLSKAVLLLAVDELCRRHPRCHYFPAYELVVDELRDYRFYDADMLHPSAQAVDYVWERFGDWAFSDATRAFLADWAPVARALSHRPFAPDSEAYSAFLRKIDRQIGRLTEKYPNFAPCVADYLERRRAAWEASAPHV